MARDTIAAIASPPGPGLRGILRLSGPAAWKVAATTCVVGGRALELSGRSLHTGRFHDGIGSQPALVLWMPGPRSYTGEDVLELHLPGSVPLLDAALRRVLEQEVRLAEPGEFTRRAFLSGRMDLTRAEGVLELVSARSQEERRAATALLVGGLEQRTADLRERFEVLRALCEASLDFDQGDAIDVPTAQLEELATELAERVEEALAWERERAPESGDPKLVLMGAPNAGKSSLFNRLAAGADQRALVSDVPGTTRDTLAARVRLGETWFELWDVAGLDRDVRGVELEAQEMTQAARRSADIVLWVVDGQAADPARPPEPDLGADASPTVKVWNKVDLAPDLPAGWCPASAELESGLYALRLTVQQAWQEATASTSRRELSARHLESLRSAGSCLEDARQGLAVAAPLDLVAEHLRAATAALDGIAGATTPEDLLDKIFSRFCLGK